MFPRSEADPVVPVHQGSRPLVLSAAEKKTWLPKAVKPTGCDPMYCEQMCRGSVGQMSGILWVPAVVPSLRHGSSPVLPSLALKNRVEPMAAALAIVDERCALTSFTIEVPARVPSLFQSSRPPVELDEYRTREPKAARLLGPPA